MNKPVLFLKFSVSLAMVFVLLVFIGCKGANNKPEYSNKPLEGVILRCAFIGGGDYENLYEEIPKFEESTGSTVSIVYKGNGFDIDKKIKMDFAANTVDYDVMWNHTSFFSQYITYLEPLDGYFTNDELKDFLPRLLDAARRNGKLWMIPRHADISCLHYRTDLFNDPKERAAFSKKYGRELEPPKTWEEFVEVAKFFSRGTSLYGTQFAGKEEALTGRFYEILFSNGGEFIDSGGTAVFNSEAGVKAASMLRELYASKAMPPDMLNYLWDDLAKNFANGNIALCIEWHSCYSSFQDPKSSKVSGKFGLARQPAGPDGVHGGWGGVHAFSIPKAAQNKEGAAMLIKFLTNPDNEYIEGKIGYLPVRTSVWERLIKEAESSKDPLAKKRLELARLQLSQDFRTPPLIPEWLPASNILFPKIQAIILGEINPQVALDEAAEEINRMLKESANK